MIALVGAGRAGALLARHLVEAGDEVVLVEPRRTTRGEALAAELALPVADLAEATTLADVVVLDLAWPLLEDVAEGVGDLTGTVVVDTTNALGPAAQGLPATPSQVCAERFRPAAYAKAFSTPSPGALAAVARRRPTGGRAVLVAAEPAALGVVDRLAGLLGLVAVDLGGPSGSELLEPPERAGAVFGRQYAPDGARQVAAAWAAGYRDVAADLADSLALDR